MDCKRVAAEFTAKLLKLGLSWRKKA